MFRRLSELRLSILQNVLFILTLSHNLRCLTAVVVNTAEAEKVSLFWAIILALRVLMYSTFELGLTEPHILYKLSVLVLTLNVEIERFRINHFLKVHGTNFAMRASHLNADVIAFLDLFMMRFLILLNWVCFEALLTVWMPTF